MAAKDNDQDIDAGIAEAKRLLRCDAEADQANGFHMLQQLSAQSHLALVLCWACKFAGWGCTPDPGAAFQFFSNDAQQTGDPLSIWILAICYYRGMGVDQDIVWAVQMMDDLANNGFVPAQVIAGLTCSAGWIGGFTNLPNYSRGLLQEAASQGDANGQWLYGLLLEDENPDEAFGFYEASAEQGKQEGKIRLAHCYLNGIGCERDIEQAKEENPELKSVLASHSFCCITAFVTICSIFVVAGLALYPSYMVSEKKHFDVNALVTVDPCDFAFRSYLCLGLACLAVLCLPLHLGMLAKHNKFRIHSAGILISMVIFSCILNTVEYCKVIDHLNEVGTVIQQNYTYGSRDWSEWGSFLDECQDYERDSCILKNVNEKKDDFAKMGLIFLIVSWVLSMFVICFFINRRGPMMLFRLVEWGVTEWYAGFAILTVLLYVRSDIGKEEPPLFMMLLFAWIMVVILIVIIIIGARYKRSGGTRGMPIILAGIVPFATIPDGVLMVYCLTTYENMDALTSEWATSMKFFAIPHYVPGAFGLCVIAEYMFYLALAVFRCCCTCACNILAHPSAPSDTIHYDGYGNVVHIERADTSDYERRLKEWRESSAESESEACNCLLRMLVRPPLILMCCGVTWAMIMMPVVTFLGDGPDSDSCCDCCKKSKIEIVFHLLDANVDIKCLSNDAYMKHNADLALPAICIDR